jgi:hypothetical protein
VVAANKRPALVEVAHATIQEGWTALFRAAGTMQREFGWRAAAEASATAEATRRSR